MQIRAPRSWEAVGVAPGREIAPRNGLDEPNVGVRTQGQDAHRRGAWRPPDLPTRGEGAPSRQSKRSSIRKPMAAQLRHGGPFLTRVPMCALIRWTPSSSNRTSAQGQHYSSLEGEQNIHKLWEASCMLPHLPPLTLHHSHPYPPFRHHLTPSRARIRRKRAPPSTGAPQTSA